MNLELPVLRRRRLRLSFAVEPRAGTTDCGDEEPLRLFAGSRLLGFLKPDAYDFPWTYASFSATGAFDEVRELFDRQNETWFGPGFAGYNSQVRVDGLDLRLVERDGSEQRFRTILIDGPRARWRMGFERSPTWDTTRQLLGITELPEEEAGPVRLRIAKIGIVACCACLLVLVSYIACLHPK